MTRQLGVLGYPLGHSISPIFHQAALDYLGVDAQYHSWRVEPSRLREKVEWLRSEDVLGANVTIPHKEAVLSMLDELDPTARDIGSVNTIVNSGGMLKGYNTDAPGFMRGLREQGAFDPRDKRAVVIGAGGAARAVVYALSLAGVASVTIVNRTLERAERLAEQARGRALDTAIRAEGHLSPALDYDLLVNCTSVGMKHTETEGLSPVDETHIRAGALVYDLIYNPPETPLLTAARKAGAATVGGLPMLVAQGAFAFERWTGREAPFELMFEAARKALG